MRLTRSIANIYDCAVDPGSRQATLCHIRDETDPAYLHLFFADPPDVPTQLRGFLKPWDMGWRQKMFSRVPKVPGYGPPLDFPQSQMGFIPFNRFQLPLA